MSRDGGFAMPARWELTFAAALGSAASFGQRDDWVLVMPRSASLGGTITVSRGDRDFLPPLLPPSRSHSRNSSSRGFTGSSREIGSPAPTSQPKLARTVRASGPWLSQRRGIASPIQLTPRLYQPPWK